MTNEICPCELVRNQYSIIKGKLPKNSYIMPNGDAIFLPTGTHLDVDIFYPHLRPESTPKAFIKDCGAIRYVKEKSAIAKLPNRLSIEISYELTKKQKKKLSELAKDVDIVYLDIIKDNLCSHKLDSKDINKINDLVRECEE